MTNTTALDPGAALDPGSRPFSSPAGTRRPVKVVQHPAFRGRSARDAVVRPVVPLRVVSLNDSTVEPRRRRVTPSPRLERLPCVAAA
jgi:hypothetical protein